MRYLALCLALAIPAGAQAADDPQPTAWTTSVQPLEAVERITMPAVDAEALKAEDDRKFLETREKALRYAVNLKVDVTPDTAGTWERLPDGELLWRLRVYSKDALSLNFAFDEYFMPAGGRLFIYAANRQHVYRPFTADDNEDHGELWTPPVFGPETVLELTIPEDARGDLRLHLALVNHDYRGFGQPGMEKSGACNIDIVCPIGDPYNDQDRANAVISTGGGTFCSGSLLNNTNNDARPFFTTAQHCGITAGNAASLVTFWNYFNSTCRPQGPGQSPPGDGQLTQFNTGSIFRSSLAASDFTLVELDDPLLPAFNLYLAGWDRTPMPAQFNDTVAIHHPNTDEMRITFAPGPTQNGGWSGPPDGTHIHAFWGVNLGVTEPGSSGSPLYTSAGNYIGQLHGGPSFCGATGPDLSDLYGRFSLSWTGTGVAAALDPANTGQIILPGRNACTFPAAPTGVAATATAPNTIQVTWSAVAGATSYNVLRATGACPQPSYTQIANVPGTTYNDTTVSGGQTYAYVVQAVVAGCPSLNSACDDATASGGCTTPPTFAGLTSATSAGTASCAVNLAWSAATPTCAGTTIKYNVYRSTTPGTPPSPATLVQSCLTTLNHTDTNVTSGTSYSYIVRAEDSQTTGTGACNNGIQDANVVERTAAPGGPSATVLDNVEGGGAFWSTAGGTGSNVWAIVTTAANSPTHSWFVADPAVVTDQYLTTVAAGNIPAAFVMSFFHRYQTEEGPAGTGYDGHVVEYSLDGGTTWTDILAAQGTVPANAARFLLNGYNQTISTGFASPIGGRRAWSGNQLTFQEVRIDMADFSGRDVKVRLRFASDNSVSDLGVWIDDITYRFPGSCTTVPNQAVAAESLAVDTAGNLVYQPNETVVVAPSWRNTGAASIALTGALTNHTGPAGPTYAITDGAASYGTIPVAGTASCGANCYSVNNTAATRPITHWDSTVLETVNPTATTKTWTLHIGDSFTDVPPSNGFYRFIETIVHKNVTGGCTTQTYCPTADTTRDAMAVFVLVSKEAPGYNPPACVAGSEMFADVPAASGFCRWIEELARRGVVAGCGGGNYCPTAPATREQMAVFVLRTLDPTLNPPACVAGSEVFADVPAANGFCRWIEELFRRGVVTGCGGGNYCPTAAVTREQMSVFLTVTFGISLYGL